MSSCRIEALDNFLLAAAFGDSKKERSSAERLLTNSEVLSAEALAEKIQAGHKDLIDVLVRRYSNWLYTIILRMVQSHIAAEDILQETWVRIIRKFQKYDSSRPLSSWLAAIAVNQCRDYWRRERIRSFWKRSSSPESSEDPDKIVASYSDKDVEKQIEISDALMNLSHKLRQVVVLKFYSGLTHDEIAQILMVPSGTVKSRLHDALMKLRKYFGEEK